MIITCLKRKDGEKTKIIKNLTIAETDILEIIRNPIKKDIKKYSSFDELKASQMLIFWGDILDKSNEYISSNWGTRSAIVLDYDKNMQIDDFIQIYKGKFRFYLHTTISNTHELNKFRVIIPTIPFIMTEYVKESIIELFPNVDPSTTNNRGFYAPHIIDSNPYRYEFYDGNMFDMKPILHKASIKEHCKKQEMERAKQIREIKNKTFIGNPNIEAYKRKTEESIDRKLKQIPQETCGIRYTALCSIAGSMISAKNPNTGEPLFDYDEVVEKILNHTNDKNVFQMLNNFLKERG